MPAEYEKGRLDVLIAEGIENTWGRSRIRPIVERDADDVSRLAREMGQWCPEDKRIPIPRAVRRKRCGGQSGNGRSDHKEMATRPITLW